MKWLLEVGALSLGGAIGVNARHFLGAWINARVASTFPWATFAINVSGSFLISLCSVALASRGPHPNLRLFLMTGILGGYTTFSTFSLETLTLSGAGRKPVAALYVATSILLGVFAAWSGAELGRACVPSVANPTVELSEVERDL